MTLYTDIHGDEVPVEVKHVEFWLAEFTESWKCPATYAYHSKGETLRIPGDPNSYKTPFISTRTNHFGPEYKVPFTVLSFRHVKHTIYTLHHKVTEITEINVAGDSNS